MPNKRLFYGIHRNFYGISQMNLYSIFMSQIGRFESKDAVSNNKKKI